MKRCIIKYIYDENGISYLKVNGMKIICNEFTLTHKATEYPQLDIKGMVDIMEDSEKHGKNIAEIAKELAELQKKEMSVKYPEHSEDLKEKMSWKGEYRKVSSQSIKKPENERHTSWMERAMKESKEALEKSYQEMVKKILEENND